MVVIGKGEDGEMMVKGCRLLIISARDLMYSVETFVSNIVVYT